MHKCHAEVEIRHCFAMFDFKNRELADVWVSCVRAVGNQGTFTIFLILSAPGNYGELDQNPHNNRMLIVGTPKLSNLLFTQKAKRQR